MNYDNIDEAVFLLVFDIGEYQADRVLSYTPYHSLESFLEIRGYKDTDDLRKKGKQMILLDDELKKKQQEFDDMKQEHEISEFNNSQNIDDMFKDTIIYTNDDDYKSHLGGVR